MAESRPCDCSATASNENCARSGLGSQGRIRCGWFRDASVDRCTAGIRVARFGARAFALVDPRVSRRMPWRCRHRPAGRSRQHRPGGHLAACRALGVEAKIRLREDSFSTIRGPIVGSLGQESAEKWTAQADLQPGQPKSDRLLGQRERLGRPGGAGAVSRLPPQPRCHGRRQGQAGVEESRQRDLSRAARLRSPARTARRHTGDRSRRLARETSPAPADAFRYCVG